LIVENKLPFSCENQMTPKGAYSSVGAYFTNMLG